MGSFVVVDNDEWGGKRTQTLSQKELRKILLNAMHLLTHEGLNTEPAM